MKITGFAALGRSNFNQRQHLSLIADNHHAPISSDAIAEGIDLVVAHLDSQTNDENWVDLVKKSPYYISRTDI